MAIKHAFTSAKTDGADATLVRPSDWNNSHTLDAEIANKVLASPISGASAAPTFRLFAPDDLVLVKEWAWMKEDFFAGASISGEFGECGMSTVGSGPTVNLNSNDQNRPGIVQRTATSAASPVGGFTSGVQGGYNPFYSLNNHIFKVTWIIKNDSAVLSNYLIRIGFGNSLSSTTPSGGAYFETTATTAPTPWNANVKGSSTVTNTTSVTIDNSWHKYEIESDGANTFSFYIDSTLVATVANTPSSTMANVPTAFVQTNATQTQILTFDYFAIAWKVTR
jgi:hypothetical protein